MGMAVFISGIILIVQYSTIDGTVESNKQIYESLTYQLENNLYDNDNDLGKKELYDEIKSAFKDIKILKQIDNRITKRKEENHHEY